MKKTLLGLVLSTFILVPTFAQAKMIKIPNEDVFINEDGIEQMSEIKSGCQIDYSFGGGRRYYNVDISCKEYIKKLGIEIKE